jgi:hypothetical protein
MNIEEQLRLYNSMLQSKIQKYHALHQLECDITALKQNIINECNHDNVTIEYESDGHKSYIVRKCTRCNFYI